MQGPGRGCLGGSIPVEANESCPSTGAGDRLTTMATILRIKVAIGKLPPRDHAELMALLHPPLDDDCDR